MPDTNAHGRVPATPTRRRKRSQQRHTVRVAVWEYLTNTEPPRRRLAYYGQELDLSTSEAERATAAGAIDAEETSQSKVSYDASAAIDDTYSPSVPSGGEVHDEPLKTSADPDDADSVDDLADLDLADADDPAGGDAAANGRVSNATIPKPPNTADLPTWIAYAVDRGLTADEATAMGRAALIRELS